MGPFPGQAWSLPHSGPSFLSASLSLFFLHFFVSPSLWPCCFSFIMSPSTLPVCLLFSSASVSHLCVSIPVLSHTSLSVSLFPAFSLPTSYLHVPEAKGLQEAQGHQKYRLFRACLTELEDLGLVPSLWMQPAPRKAEWAEAWLLASPEPHSPPQPPHTIRPLPKPTGSHCYEQLRSWAMARPGVAQESKAPALCQGQPELLCPSKALLLPSLQSTSL